MFDSKGYKILRQGTGRVAGENFTVGSFMGNHHYDRIIEKNGLSAPDLLETIYMIILNAAFGSTGEESVVLTPATKDDEIITTEIKERLNTYLGLQEKISKLGRIYLTYGTAAIRVYNEVIMGEVKKFYDIIEEPYNIKRIEYRERLIGYYDSKGNPISNDDVIFVYNKHSNETEDYNLRVSISNINPKGDQTELTLARKNKKNYNKDFDKDSIILPCKSVRGVSIFNNAEGVLDICSSSTAESINNLEKYKPKSVITVKSNIKDVGQRNDVFNKVVNSVITKGSIAFIECPDGVDIDVTQLVESQKDAVDDDLELKTRLATMYSFISPDILSGEKSPFEDQRTLAVIKDLRNAILSMVKGIIKSEFGIDALNKVRVRIVSTIEKEWETKVESLEKAVEVMTMIGDFVSLNKKKLKPGALTYLSNLLGIDFGDIIEDIPEEELERQELIENEEF